MAKLSVLRECRRVLRRGGRIAGYLIHVPDGLSDEQKQRAVVAGPAEILSERQPAEMMATAGLARVFVSDVSEEFRETCVAMIENLAKHERQLRAVEGNERFEDELSRKNETLAGIDEGLLLRSLVVSAAP